MLSSLSAPYRKSDDSMSIETKSGVFIFSGEPHRFHEWEFRTMARYHGSELDDRWKLASKIVEGLRGNAFLVAKDFGLDALNDEDSVPKLVAAMRAMVFPLQAREAKILYTQGHKQGGVLSRQSGESMMSYISRRKRWWVTLQELDKTTIISENIRADLLLDLANLSETEKLMIKTSCGNKSDFDLISNALLDQHPNIENKERRSARSEEARHGKGNKPGWTKKPFQKKPSYHAHYTIDDHDMTSDMSDEIDHAFLGNEQADSELSEESDLAEDNKDSVELNVLSAFLANDDFQEDNSDSIAILSDVAQTEVVAFFARSKAKGKGKRLPPKSPFKPFGKFDKPKGRGKSVMSIEDRRKKLKEVKAKSTCKKCGKKGHWAGDPECQPKTAHYSVQSQNRIADKGFSIPVDEDSDSYAFVAVTEPKAKAKAKSLLGATGTPGVTEPAPPTPTVNPEEFDLSDEFDQDMFSQTANTGEQVPEEFDRLFTFGQYRNESYAHVTHTNPGYAVWACSETNPGPGLADFVQWVKRFFIIDLSRRTLVRRAVPIDEGYEIIGGVIPARTRQSRLSQLQPSADGPCRPQCLESTCSRAGSTVHTIKLTCFKCGHSRTIPRTPIVASMPASTCPHNNTDARGSNRNVHKTFCVDCMTVIDVCTQAEWKQRQELGQSVARSTARTALQHDRLQHSRQLTPSQVQRAIRLFSNMQSAQLRGLGVDSTVSSSDMVSTLTDAIDIVADEANDTSTASGSGSVAYTSIASGDEGDSAVVMTCLTANLLQEPERAQLPTVNIITDPGIWVVLDEGCNSTCHGLSWAVNAETKLYHHGYSMPWISQKTKSYAGVGQTTTTGKRRIAFALKLEPSDLVVNGTFDSHELKGSQAPLLLSLSAQAHMGLIKDVRNGTCLMADYPGQYLQLARTHDTGLFAMCISHFVKDQWHEVLAPLRLGPDPEYDQYYGSDEPSSPEGVAFPATITEYPPLEGKDTQKDLEITLVTLGLENFEIGDKAKRWDKSVHNWIKNEGRGKSYDFNLSNPGHKAMLLKSFKANYDIAGGFKDNEIIFVDSRAFDDAAHDMNLRNHLGCHPVNMDTIVNSESFRRFFPDLQRQVMEAICTGVNQLMIVTVCKSGRHRSVALREFFHFCLYRTGFNVRSKFNCSEGYQWRNTCSGKCVECRWPDGLRDKPSKVKDILNISLNMWNSNLRRWKLLPPDDQTSPVSPPDRDVRGEGSVQLLEAVSETSAQAVSRARAQLRTASVDKVVTTSRKSVEAAFEKQAERRAQSASAMLKKSDSARNTSTAATKGSSLSTAGTGAGSASQKSEPEAVADKQAASTKPVSTSAGKAEAVKKEPQSKDVDSYSYYTDSDTDKPQATPATKKEDDIRTESENDMDVEEISTFVSGNAILSEAILKRIYSVFNPRKDVDALIRKYPGKTDALVTSVMNKYKLSNDQCLGIIDSVAKELQDDTHRTTPDQDMLLRVRWLEDKVRELQEELRSRQDTSSHRSRAREESASEEEDHQYKHARTRDRRGDADDSYRRTPREPDAPATRRTPHEQFHPRHLSAKDYDDLFLNRSHNFISWIGPGDDKYYKSRVNGKFDAWDTKIKYPTDLRDYTKFTVTQSRQGCDWEVVEENVPIDSWITFANDDYPKRCLIFAVPPHRESVTRAAYFAFVPDVSKDRVGVMKKHSKKLFDSSAKTVDYQDSVMWNILTNTLSSCGRMFKVLMLGFASVSACTYIADFTCISDTPWYDVSWRTHIQQFAEPFDFVFIKSPFIDVQLYKDIDDSTAEVLFCLSSICKSRLDDGYSTTVFDNGSTTRWTHQSWTDLVGHRNQLTGEIVCRTACRGDLTFITDSTNITNAIFDWSNSDDHFQHPKSVDQLDEPELIDVLVKAMTQDILNQDSLTAFPAMLQAEIADEEGPLDEEDDETGETAQALVPLDDAGDDVLTQSGQVLGWQNEYLEAEQNLLDEMPLPGFPQDEATRRRLWAAVPRKARVAIRRLHHMTGHKPKSVLLQILKGAHAPQEYINAVRQFRCDSCDCTSDKPRTHPVAAPSPYSFNHELHIDVLEVQDDESNRYSFLNILCVGTTFQVVVLVREGGGTPTSTKCLEQFMKYWVAWAGWPRIVTTDRGLRNRGAFSRALGANGVYLRQAGVEAPEQIGRGERHGGLFKRNFKRVIKEHHVVGKTAVKIAAAEVVAAKNDLVKRGGFSPAQWVLGKSPRGVGHLLDEEELGHLGVLEQQADGETMFGMRAAFRHTSRKAFVKEDCGRKAAAALLRRAAPLPGRYDAGDLVCYRRENQNHTEPSTVWSSPSRIIGFEGKTVWVSCEGVPVATAIDKLRPCTASEVLAYLTLSKDRGHFQHTVDSEEQQGFVDERNAVVPSEEMPDIEADDEFSDDERRDTLAALPMEASAVIRLREDEGLPEEEPPTSRRRLRRTATESRAVSVTSEEPDAEASGATTPLLEQWNRTNTTGAGVGLIERLMQAERSDTEQLHAALAVDTQVREEFKTFMANRFDNDSCQKFLKKKKNYSSKKRREMAGKTINFKSAPPEVQQGLLISRSAEWKKWQNFNAAEPVMGEVLQNLLDEGHQAIPTQWIDSDKNEHKRVPGGPHVEPLYKSRLVGLGNLELGDIRSDSPTCDIEAQNMIFSFAASNKLIIKSADITNAYFQGEELDRILLFKQPDGGLEGLPESAHLLARVPIYGTKDAGRGFWKKLRKTIVSAGMKENHVMKALYSYEIDGDVKMILGSHVDDLLWANKPEAQHIVDEILTKFQCGKIEQKEFRYCGKEIRQDEDFNIFITCRDTTLKTQPIKIAHGRKMIDKLNENEKTQLKSVAGSLSWVARQCRPDLSYRVSKMQSCATHGCVRDLKDVNKTLEYAKATADQGLTFKAGILDWNNMISCVVTDASHANEVEINDLNKTLEPHRSQGARLLLLGTPDLMQGDKGHFHIIGYNSTIVKRVCRATVQAEAYSLQAGVEEGDRIRAAIADMKNKLDPKKWESTSAASMKQVWFTDCKSVEQALLRPTMAKIADKRLSIEIASLRQSLWRKVGTEVGDPLSEDSRPLDATDYVRWIDTDVMIADPLTKAMDSSKLITALGENIWDIKQPIESVLKKRAKQLQRRKTTDGNDPTESTEESLSSLD